MNPTTGRSVMDRVMHAPELFELVLLCVDTVTLLTSAQRVSRLWHQTIDESPAIQGALFFLPTASNHDDCNGGRNMLLAHYFPAWFSWFFNGGMQIPSMYEFKSQRFAQPDKIAAFMFPEATWRSMLVHQGTNRAAGFALGLWRSAESQLHGSLYVDSTLYLPADGDRGFTMGRYYDLAVSFVLDEIHPLVYWPDGFDSFLAMEEFSSSSNHHYDDGSEEQPLQPSETENSGDQQTRPLIRSRDLKAQKLRLTAQADVIWHVNNSQGVRTSRCFIATYDFSDKFIHQKHQGKGSSSSLTQLWSGLMEGAFPVRSWDMSGLRD